MDLTRKPTGKRTVVLGLMSTFAIALAVYAAETPHTAAGYKIGRAHV